MNFGRIHHGEDGSVDIKVIVEIPSHNGPVIAEKDIPQP